MLLSFRPLVSVSVVTLLGWCWYSFRRRRRTHLLTEEEVCFLDEKSPVPSYVLGESNLKMDHRLSRSPEMSNSTDMSRSTPLNGTEVNPGIPSVTGLTKGVRPDPEGQVSIRARHEKSTIPDEGLLYCGEAGEDDSGLESDPVCVSVSCRTTDSDPSMGQQSGPVHTDSLSDLSPDRGLNQNDMEKISSCLVQQVIEGEKWKNQEPRDVCELVGASRSLEDGFRSFQQQYSSDDVHPNTGSFSGRMLTHLGSSIGDDSGCCSCVSEDVSGADGLTDELSEGQRFMMTTTGPDSKTAEDKGFSSISGLAEKEDEACIGTSSPGLVVESLSTEALVNSSSSAPPPAPPITLWDIEVPAHLVGRLIGKQGKFVNFLKQSSGAKIYVSTLPFTQDVQICHIQGSQQQVDDALALIRKKFKDLDLSNCIPLPCLPVTSWLLLPQDVFVEVIVSRVESGYHLFIQQYSHPSYQALPTLTQHMQFCYSQPGCPSLPKPVEVGVICAAPVSGSGWQRAQIIQYDEESGTAHVRYVDNGGYDTVNSATLRQIRSDFVTLPFQASEVLLDNITPLPGEVAFSPEAKTALEELTANVALILKVTGSQDGLPLVHMWKQMADEVVLVNKLLAERGVCTWLDAP
nr:LOW QUALITY PROTEIN: A-kinase anchor protein 1, mitochondrial [Misgurnus anguillicaudatus]